MKTQTTRITIFLSILFLMGTIFNNAVAQKVYSCDSKYDADIKVFVVDSKYDADLWVYKVDSQYDVNDDGLWFFCDSKYDAKKKFRKSSFGDEKPSRKVESGLSILDNNEVNFIMALTMSLGAMGIAGWLWDVPFNSILPV